MPDPADAIFQRGEMRVGYRYAQTCGVTGGSTEAGAMDNRGQTTVYLNHQTTLPTQSLPTGVAYPIYLVPHAVPTPSLLVLQKQHSPMHNFHSSHGGFHQPNPAPVRIETIHDRPLRGLQHLRPASGTTNAASITDHAHLVRCPGNSTSDIPPGALPSPPARDSIQCNADKQADSFLPA